MHKKQIFYGATIIGERGQVVIPIKARKEMNVTPGETLLTFGIGKDMLILTKLSHVEKFASHLAVRLTAIRHVIKKSTRS